MDYQIKLLLLHNAQYVISQIRHRYDKDNQLESVELRKPMVLRLSNDSVITFHDMAPLAINETIFVSPSFVCSYLEPVESVLVEYSRLLNIDPPKRDDAKTKLRDAFEDFLKDI